MNKKIIELSEKKMIINNTGTNNIIIKITEEMDNTKMNKTELLNKCKELGITNCGSKNKSQLLELINLIQTNKGDSKNKSQLLELINLIQTSKCDITS